MYIQDIFFFHEHPRKINIWAGSTIVSPYIGPLIAAFIINKMPWPNAFWVNTGLTALGLLLILGLMDETIYNRRIPPSEQVTPKSRLLRLVGVEQWRGRHNRQTFTQAFMRPIIAISKVPVLLSTVYYFLNFAWIIGVNATISIWLTEFYKFKPYNLGMFAFPLPPLLHQHEEHILLRPLLPSPIIPTHRPTNNAIPPGMFYWAFIIGVLLGAIIGHWLHDLIGKWYMRRHGGTIEPEARLIIIWIASPLMALSILLLGFALEHHWHYIVIAIFAAGQVIGIMFATTGLNAYLLDSYPEGSGEVGAWINVGRTMGGFMATYIEIDWVKRDGEVNAFGAQTGITAAAGLIILFLGWYGKRIRKAQGRMMFAM